MNHFTSWLLWSAIAAAIGYALAVLIGYPGGVPGLDKLLDKLAALIEKISRRLFVREEKGGTLAGVFALVMTILLVFVIPFALLILFYRLTPILGVIVEALLCWQLISTKMVRTTCTRIHRAIKRKDIRTARRVAASFEDDVENADEDTIIDAAVNYNAETIPAASVGPILYSLLVGAPLAALYRSVKMLALRLSFDDGQTDIGAPARGAEAVLDFIPSRLSALLMLVGGFILGYDVKNARGVLGTDRKNGGANLGWPRACLAGLLNIRLYGSGEDSENGAVGVEERRIENDDIMRSWRLHLETSIITLACFCLIKIGIFLASAL